MKKLDRRIARTRQSLNEALVTLSLDAGYENITIRDITNEADVGYATFFRHFKSKDDLFVSCLTGVLAELDSELKPNMTPYEEAVAMFDFIRKRRRIFLVASTMPRDHPALAEATVGVREMIRARYTAVEKNAIPMDFSIDYLLYAVWDLIQWWLSEGSRYSPEYMATIQAELIVKATEQVALEHRTQRVGEEAEE